MNNSLMRAIWIYARKIKDDIWWSIPFVHQKWRRVSKAEFARQFIEFNAQMTQSNQKKWLNELDNDPEKFPVYIVKPRPENPRHTCFYKFGNRRSLEFWTREQALDFEKRVAEMQADND